MKILIYSHTDYKDVWIPLFKSLKENLSNVEGYFCINEKIEIPLDLKVIVYDDNLKYTERLKNILEEVDSDPFIFMHEDMFLYNKANEEILEKYFGIIKNGNAKAIKLIPVGSNLLNSNVDETLFYSEFSKFSIQPTVTTKSHMNEILNKVGELNIWDFESKINLSEGEFISKIGSERKIGIFHYESLVFPYIATAIVKGKLNFSEYPILENILKENKIDKNIRGIV